MSLDEARHQHLARERIVDLVSAPAFEFREGARAKDHAVAHGHVRRVRP